MKTIIINIDDMSESIEAYQSKPNPILVYTIYIVFLIIVVGFGWMCLFTIEDVVKSEGLFKGRDSVYDISSGTSGEVSLCAVEDGEYVEKGDTLYVVTIDSLSETIISYQDDLKDANSRLEMLDAYEESLNRNISISEEYSSNPYYNEFISRYELLQENIKIGKGNTEKQENLNRGSVDSIASAITQYENKIKELEKAKECIRNRKNKFQPNNSYYYSLVNSYICSYNYSERQYDNIIAEYKSQLEKLEKSDENNINEQKSILLDNIADKEEEKNQALMTQESNQISNIEQKIDSYKDSIISLNINLESAKLELNNNDDVIHNYSVLVLTEKDEIFSERILYEDKKRECENWLNNYNIQNDNCTISAPSSGYFYCSRDIKQGTYIQEGSDIGSIYPENESEFYAEIYVNNSDIGKIEEGQEVKFEIQAFPSSEYGYFKGSVTNISKDITVNQNTGYAYYIVKVKCENMKLKNKEGEEAKLKNGMMCNGKIVVGEKKVIRFLLEKINLID